MAITAGPALAQCEPAWLAGYRDGDLNIPPTVSQNWDADGPGPARPVVIVAGDVGRIGGLRISNIAQWDGSHWSNLGGGMNDIVSGLTTWDPDGPGPAGTLLIAAGPFTSAGGTLVNHVAAWDGTAWMPLGAGVPVSAFGLAVHDADGPGPGPAQLYATGSVALGSPDCLIYRWDGSAWTSIVTTASVGFVRSLVSYDPDGAGPALPLLAAGGTFSAIDGVSANSIAVWDGASWARLGTGVASGGSVMTMAAYDPDDAGPATPLLAVGGQFAAVGGSVSGGLAVWNGSTWQGIGSGVYPSAMWVNELDVIDTDGPGGVPPRLAVGGQYIIAGGNFAPALAQWNGSTFEKATFPYSGTGTINTVANWTDEAGGASVFVSCFYEVAPNFPAKLVEWSNGVLRYLGSAPDGEVRALARFPLPGVAGPIDPPVIAAGDFDYIGDDLSSSLAVWDGRTWEPLGGNITGSTVYTLDVSTGPGGPVLAVGGLFTVIDSFGASNIALYDGTAWSSPGAGFNGAVRALRTCDPDGPGPIGTVLVAGGSFTSSGASFRARIAYWNGSAWMPMDFGFADGSVTCLTIADVDGPGPLPEVLVAGGTFLSAAGTSTPRIAYWNGSSWRPLGAGLDNTVNGLGTFDVDGAGPLGKVLIAVGLFGTPAGPDLNGAAYWDGSAWVKLGSGFIHGATTVTSYTPAGGGPDVLVAVGAFPGGASTLTGGAWVPMGTGVLTGLAPRVYSLLPIDPDGAGPSGPIIMAGGNFDTVGGQVSVGVARWATLPAPWIITDPQAPSGDPATFTAEAAWGYAELPGGLDYQWFRNGSPVADGPGGASPGGGTVQGASGTLTLSGPVTLTIADPTGSDAGQYTCVFSNDCGEAATDPAVLGDICRADLTGDGLVDFSDYLEFLNLYDAGDPAVDFNGDGLVDFADYLEFLNLYDAGC